MKGANVMCPGLTSPGGQIEEKLEAKTIVVPYTTYHMQLGFISIDDMI
jgi:predicted ribosome-associated RNA-binding protein Tma20